MVFKNFQETDIIKGRTQPISYGVWSDGDFQANTFYTYSFQTQITGSNEFDIKNGLYYYDVYDVNPESNSAAQPIFSVSYGNINGSGSISDLNIGAVSPTKAIYNQFKNILLNPDDKKFTFSISGSSLNGYDSDDIWIISFASTAYKERLDPGTIEFTLNYGSTSVTFIDDSVDPASIKTSKVFNIVVGTLNGGILSKYDSSGKGFGLFYPDTGIIILNVSAIQNVLPTFFPNLSNTSNVLNHKLLYDAISVGGNFKARSTEFVSTRHYFVRVGNQEFNYSNNPSFVNTSTEKQGDLLFDEFIEDPKVYITTVGLYNETNDLIAVAKLSQPLQKTFSNEALIRVKLDF